VGVARERVQEQDGVRPVGVELPVGLVGERDRPKLLAAIEFEFIRRMRKLEVLRLTMPAEPGSVLFVLIGISALGLVTAVARAMDTMDRMDSRRECTPV